MLSPALNRAVWAILLLAIVILGWRAKDNIEGYFATVGTLTVDAEPGSSTVNMTWRGKIEAPMERELDKAFAQYRDQASTFVLSLNSPGGNVDHGARVIRVLKQIKETHALETVIESGRNCASMCVPVYLAGQKRRAASDAQFMFHNVSFSESLSDEQVSVPDASIAAATDSFVEKYLVNAGVDAGWAKKIRVDMGSGNDVWKSAQQLIDENAGIVQSVY